MQLANSFKIPSVGSRVRVTTEYANPNRTFVTVGSVVESMFKDPKTFAVKTGNPMHPVSEISLDFVKNIELISGKFATFSSKARHWKVKSKGSIYLVSYGAGKFTCTCKGFEFRKICKHVSSVRNKV